MDVIGLIKNKGMETVPNPKFNPKSKKNKEPRTIDIQDVTPDNSSALNLALVDARTAKAFDAKTVEKYARYGLNYNTWEDLDSQLAEKQSNWEKARNALYQTVVNEVGLGTLKGISDLVDFTVGGLMRLGTGENNDYTNPVSQKLQEWQDEFKYNYDVYTKSGVDISNGGLSDFGWWMSNMPSIASSLTLLIPSTGAVKLAGALAKAANVGRKTSKLRKFLTNINKVDKAVEEGKDIGKLGRLSQWANRENTVQTANRLVENTLTGFTSRVMENYQEANQVYNDMLPEMLYGDKQQGVQGIADMDESEYQNFCKRNANKLQGVDTSNRTEVAKALAKEAADRTFQIDMINGFFDVYELYGLRNFKPLKNGPMRAKVRRAHLNSIKYAGKTDDEIEQILKGRTRFQKTKDWLGDKIYGSRMALSAQLSEGVEEGLNYIAQEEGMHYGHVLLGSEDESSFWDNRIAEYVKNPQLYESAFWGVAGGVIFQAGGSGFNRAQIAYNRKEQEKKRKPDEKTGEAVPETPWHAAFEDPEIEARVNSIKGRAHADAILKSELEQIKDGVDPWSKNPDGTNRKLDSEEEKAVARDRAYRKRAISLLMDSMFNGNWDLTRAYLESDEVRDKLVEAGIISQEEAVARQKEARQLADKLEDSYSRNLRAVGNAARLVKGEDDKEEIPIEYLQIIASENMYHELDAEQYQRNIDAYTPLINSEEERIADELKANGIDYKKSIQAYVLAQQLGQIEAELEETKKRASERDESAIDPRTVSGQVAIRQLELRKQVLTRMIDNLTPSLALEEENNEAAKRANKIAKAASSLVTLRAVAATESNGKGGYRMNTANKRYKDLDDAIVKAFNAETDEEWNTASKALFALAPSLEGHTRESFKEAAHAADVFNENIAKALGENGAIEQLNEYSNSLLQAYATVTYNEINKAVELAQIAKDRKSIRALAFAKSNEMGSARYFANEMAVNGLKGIFKKYKDKGDLSRLLAYGTISKQARDKLKSILSPDDLQTYDGFMQILALNTAAVTGRGKNTSILNDELPEIVAKALYESSQDEFEDYVEPSEREAKEEETKETEKKSTTSEKPKSEPKNKSKGSNTATAEKAKSEQAKGQKIDFTHDAQGHKLTTPYADVTVNDDGAPIKLSIRDKRNDSTTYMSITLIPEDGNDDAFELDFIGDYGDDLASDKLNENFFLIKKPIVSGGTIIRNPQVTIDNEGNIIEFKPGIIDNPETTDEEIEEPKQDNAPIPSTGVEVERTDEHGDVNPETFESYPEPEDDNADYDIDDVRNDITQLVLNYAMAKHASGEEYDENEVYELIVEQYGDLLDDDELQREFNVAKEAGRYWASQLKLNVKEFNDLAEFVATSTITDTELNADEASAANKQLEKLFESILDNYIKRSVPVTDGGKKVISLENLLRYANDVGGNIQMGHMLYDKFVELISQRDDCKLTEGRIKNLKQESIVRRAEMTSEERFDDPNGRNRINGRTIDVDYIIENRSEEEKQKLYDVLDKLQPGAPISFKIVDNGYGIQFSTNGTVIAAIPVPKKSGTGYEMNNNGWKVDIPFGNDGTQGKLEQLFIQIMVNPDNNPKFEPIIAAIEKAMYTKRWDNIKDKKENKAFIEACENIIQAMKDAGLPMHEYLQFKNGKEEKDAGRYIVNIYRGVKMASEQWLAKSGLTEEEYRQAIINRRTESIHRWFSRLKDSYDTADVLSNNKNVAIQVDTINEGGLIMTSPDEALPINNKEAIGSNYKNGLQIVVASIHEAGTLYSTDGTSTEFSAVGAANTFVSIPRKNGEAALIHAFPQPIGASHFKGVMKTIHNEVLDEFERLLKDWSDNPNKSSDDIANFINTLCSSRNGNNPLFKGFKVSKLTGGYEGIQIEYTENGKRRYIHLFDKNTFGDYASVIRFPGKKPKAFQRDKSVRKEVIKQFRDIVSKSLNYNIEFDYVKGNRDLKGYAKRNTKGEFIIQIPNGKRHKFKSYKDFVVNNGVVKVTTRTLDGKTNFYRGRGSSNLAMDNPMYTYKIVNASTTPVERSNAQTRTSTPIPITGANKGDAIKEAIQNNENDPSLGETIMNSILDDSKLKILNNSKIFTSFGFGNIIFVDNSERGFGEAIAAHLSTKRKISGKEVPKGTIVVTQKWIDMLNSPDSSKHDEAARHLIHELVHRKLSTLPKKDKAELFNELRNIYNDFVAANEADGVREDYAVFEYNTNEKAKAKYYKDGEINDKGLEEFLVESLTRPYLAKRLNSISADGKRITKQKIGNIKSKNLLQRLVAAIAKAFGFDINKGSLLEKEYKIFEQIGSLNESGVAIKTAQEKVTKKNKQLALAFEENKDIEENVVQEVGPENIVGTMKSADELGVDEDMIDESSIADANILDVKIASLGQVRDSIIPENRNIFESLVNNGGIEIYC